MSEYIVHTVNYTVDELVKLAKNSEVFRQYPKRQNCAKVDFRAFLSSPRFESIVIEVSNLGNIKINGKIVQPYEKEPGYWYVQIADKVEYLVYRLVAETWCEFLDEDSIGWQVHHIKNDGTINRPENLIWIRDGDHKRIPTR